MSRKLSTFITAAALSALPAMGVPAWPGLLRVTQPDGTVIELRLNGDERHSWFTDATGECVMKKSPSGMWVSESSSAEALVPGRMPALDPDGRTTYPTTAPDVHSLVVLLEYADEGFSIDNPQAEFDLKCNMEGYGGYGARGSLRDYWIDQSGGLFSPVFDVLGPVKLPEKSAWYAELGRAGDHRFGGGLRYALEQLNAQGFDFSRYDYDGDGVIDTVYFIYCGHGSHDTGDMTRIWPHQGDYDAEEFGDLLLDGKRFKGYACSNELIADHRIPDGGKAPWLDGIGTIAHEYAHVLGLPDFYDTGMIANTTVPGYYSLMCQGCYNAVSTCPVGLSAYEKWCLRWLDPLTDPDPGTLVLQPQSRAGNALRITTPRPGEFFMVESRDLGKWDACNAESGVMIWHVEYDAVTWAANQVNSNGRPHVLIHYSGGSERDGVMWPSAKGQFFIYPEGELPLKPNNIGTPLDAYLTSIAYDGETGTATLDWQTVTERPQLTAEMLTPSNGGPDSRLVNISWTPVDGAEAYMLTVYRESSRGRSYIGGCNEKIVTGSSYLLDNLQASAWESELHASVRVIKGLPAVEPGAEIVFVPRDLENTALGVVSADDCGEPVYYTLDGVRCGSRPDAPGIYIERCGRRVAKVKI